MKIIIVYILMLTTSCNFVNNDKQVAKGITQDSTQSKTIIVDVRSVEEWNNDGHAECTVNYPIDEFPRHIESLRGYDKIIVVCRSGNRSGKAKTMLEEAGFKNVENKGAWTNIKCK